MQEAACPISMNGGQYVSSEGLVPSPHFDIGIQGAVSDSPTIIPTSHNDSRGVWRWDEVCMVWTSLSRCLFFIPHTTASVTFICTNKCNIMHAFQERPSKTVDFSPCLETLLPSGVVGRHVIWTSLFQAYPGLGDDVDGRVWHSCRRVCVCKCFLLNYVIFP